jgi:Holliday junction DNA helicase RuvB
MGKKIKSTSGPALERAGDLAAILTNLSEGDVLFLDEIHRINKTIEEYLYPALEEYKLNLILGKGPMARTMELKLPKFTLIGATTRPGLLSAPLRNRFGATFQLNFYNIEDVKKIIERSGNLLKIKMEPEAITAIAERSRFTPRVANRLVKRVRDFAQVQGAEVITEEIAKKSLDALEVDLMGLEPSDRNILQALIEKFGGGPVGLQSLAAAAMEEEETILDIYEPYLMQCGLLERTPKGRIATTLAYNHLGLGHLRKQTGLF